MNKASLICLLGGFVLGSFLLDAAMGQTPLFVADPVTPIGAFTDGIEGPACDVHGNVYAVNFHHQGTIGRIDANGEGEVYVELPSGSVGNGIRFGLGKEMFVADYTGHNILTVSGATRTLKIFSHDDRMNQPNDLAVGPDGTLYASDPNWSRNTGQLWRIGLDGRTTRLAVDMGTTNGIEVSPDGKTLYVGESEQRLIWSFRINNNGSLSEKQIFMRFSEHGLDGMRSDVDGNLYITRYGAGTVLKVSPRGDILREIDVLGSRPSNLCLGGLDGQTVYVTEVEHRRLIRFHVDRPGLAWTRLKAN